MNNGIIKEIKKYILKGLESKIEQILKDKSKNMFLTKRDILSLPKFMERHEILSYSVIRYIFKRSIYSRDLNKKIIVTFDRIIIIACKKGNLKVVRLLLSDEIIRLYKTFYISIKLNYGFGWACVGGNLDLVKFLLRFSYEQKISLMKINPYGDNNRALLCACQFGHIDIVKFLLEDVVKLYPTIKMINRDLSGPIISACNNNQIEVVKFLLSREMKELYPKTYPYGSSNEILRGACGMGNFELVKLLLSDEVLRLYPNTDQCAKANYPIVCASQSSRYNIVKLLLSDEIISRYPKMDSSIDVNSVLRYACEDGEIEIVKYLLSNEMLDKFASLDPGYYDNYCLRIAKKHGRTEIVEFLSGLYYMMKWRKDTKI